MGLEARQLSRTGSSIAAFVQICEWHVMHVFVGGIPAKRDLVTVS